MVGGRGYERERKMKGSHVTLSCSESLYLEGDTSLTGQGIRGIIRVIHFAEK